MSKTFKNMKKTFRQMQNSCKEQQISSGDSRLDSLEKVKRQQAMKALAEGTITREDFLELKCLEQFPEELKEIAYKVFALNYDCESLVGLVTDTCTNTCTAKAESFFNENGTLNKDKFREAFPYVALNGTLEHYESVFVVDINVIEFDLAICKEYKVKCKYVSDIEMEEFARRVNNLNLDTITVADIVAIQKDLWVLFRAWQESSIDYTKDKSKKFVVAMKDVLGGITIRKISFDSISINEYEVKFAKYNNMEIPQIVIDFNEADEENDMFFETIMTDAQHDIRCAIEPVLRRIAGMAVSANNSIFEDYIINVKENAELGLTIQRIFKMILNIRKDTGIKLTKEDYALLRCIIVKDAEDLGITDRMEYVRVALGVAGCNLYVNKNDEIVVSAFDVKRFSRNIFLVEKLFGNMLVLEKALLFDSKDLIHEDKYIMMEVEPRHIYEDVENGKYTFTDGCAYDAGNILFDTTSELSGEVIVSDEGVFFLYDPTTELDNIPEITSIFIEKKQLLADEDDTNAGQELYSLLKDNS